MFKCPKGLIVPPIVKLSEESEYARLTKIILPEHTDKMFLKKQTAILRDLRHQVYGHNFSLKNYVLAYFKPLCVVEKSLDTIRI